MTHSSKKTIAVIGPTASGKSAAAIAIAQYLDGAIIGADSRQVYRHMDLGSGKEPGTLCNLRKDTQCIKTLPKELSATLRKTPHLWRPYISDGVAHYMIDIVAPSTPYSAAQFTTRAQKIHRALHKNNILPIICGGTHFWVQSLVEKAQFPMVPPNPALRKRLESMTTPQLLAQIANKDPRRAHDITIKNEHNNRHRLIRALEIIDALGAVPHTRPTPPNPQNTLILAVVPEQEQIKENITARLQPRLDAGMLDEIYNLHHIHGVSWAQLERWGLEYTWCARFLRDQCTLDEMKLGIMHDSYKFAKRQLTWIRRWERSGAHIQYTATQDSAILLTQKFLQ